MSYFSDRIYELSPDDSFDSSYESDDESELYFDDFEETADFTVCPLLSDKAAEIPEQSTSAVEIPEQSTSPAKIQEQSTSPANIQEHMEMVSPSRSKAAAKGQKKKRNLGILSNINRVQKRVFNRLPLIETSPPDKFQFFKGKYEFKKRERGELIESQPPESKDKSPLSPLKEKKEYRSHEPKVSPSKCISSPKFKCIEKRYTKSSSVLIPSTSKYVPQPSSSSSSEQYSKSEKYAKPPTKRKTSTSRYISPTSALKERKKKYSKKPFEPKPSTSKYVSSSSSSSPVGSPIHSHTLETEDVSDDYSKLPVRERLQKYSTKFLEFQRRQFNILKAAENELILKMRDLDSIIRDSMKICKGIVDFQHAPPETEELLNIENMNLMYYFGSSSRLFDTLNENFSVMGVEIWDYAKKTDKALLKIKNLLKGLMKAILDLKPKEETPKTV
ncbi:hypothetical protein NPIL_118211 [Nephila pilipes]|uniref:Uncharacterized protein n=1 Tax=Nephila pilipes TaxID=299642 RepID=A0A8X6QE26_NEPPI|nr:hypothetical protein NPIL_118211 [Nephila pilipes]